MCPLARISHQVLVPILLLKQIDVVHIIIPERYQSIHSDNTRHPLCRDRYCQHMPHATFTPTKLVAVKRFGNTPCKLDCSKCAASMRPYLVKPGKRDCPDQTIKPYSSIDTINTQTNHARIPGRTTALTDYETVYTARVSQIVH